MVSVECNTADLYLRILHSYLKIEYNVYLFGIYSFAEK